MTQSFQGRKIIVTGAATGIGKATTEALIASGASVALWDIDKAACEAIAANSSEKAIALEAEAARAAAKLEKRAQEKLQDAFKNGLEEAFRDQNPEDMLRGLFGR